MDSGIWLFLIVAMVVGGGKWFLLMMVTVGGDVFC